MPPRKDKVLLKIVAPPEVKKRGKKSESAASEEVEIQEKRRFVWTSDCKQALVNAYESRWNSVFSKPVSQSDAWEEICNEVVAAVPPITVNIQYLDAEKCKTKLKNIRTTVQDYTNNLDEACEKPEFYDQFRRFMRGSVVTQGPVKIRDSGTGTQPIMRTAADSLPAKLSINEEDSPKVASEEGLMIDFLATANKDSDFVQRQKRQTERLNTWIKQPFDLNSPIPLLSSSPTKNNAPELDRPDIPLPTCTIESTKIRKEDPEKPQPTPKQKRKREQATMTTTRSASLKSSSKPLI
ncbi:hypothetical protein BCR33DRAFT_772426 [Rhizoclosmatium globosum]|uniref:Uncharacterized protein n=1 Tax=Rhizoclosmatium globosum TaxID=329046 RepID=A0A1Y2B448_9FUNG|nr:hypothetical protein BCR33DRAFT_772426 [Rhizoclosmatium globosum]|eukprot:ORY29612.1 hypothetical protein BCR33DRAFT_772426 [Rhizoclosmatium globosum]